MKRCCSVFIFCERYHCLGQLYETVCEIDTTCESHQMLGHKGAAPFVEILLKFDSRFPGYSIAHVGSETHYVKDFGNISGPKGCTFTRFGLIKMTSSQMNLT